MAGSVGKIEKAGLANETLALIREGKSQAQVREWLATRNVHVSHSAFSRWLAPRVGSAPTTPAPRRVASEAVKAVAVVPEVVDQSASLAAIRDALMELARDPNATMPQVQAAIGAGKMEVARLYIER